MGAINLLHDALDALWTVVAPHAASPAILLELKQKTQGILLEFDSSENPLHYYGTDGIDRNRARLQESLRELYSEDELPSNILEVMFDSASSPEYSALTEVLVRYIAVRDEMIPDSGSDSD